MGICLLYSQTQEWVEISQKKGILTISGHGACEIKGPPSPWTSESLLSWLVVSAFLQGQVQVKKRPMIHLFSSCRVGFWVRVHFQGKGKKADG